MQNLQTFLTFLAVALVPATLPAQSDSTKRGASVDTSPLPARLYDRVHALCIGIDKYKSSEISPLKWAENDATELGDVFENRFGYDVQRLVGSSAGRTAILDAIAEYKTKLGPNDALIIFFAGHGQTVELDAHGRAGFLIPFDADLDLTDTREVQEWHDAAIGMHELGESIREMKARHVLILADACYSGFLGKRSGFDQRVDLQELVRRPSRMVITAGTEDQTATEVEALRHGIFTHVLLEQLGNDFPTSATEIFSSVRRGVARLSDGKMLPQLREVVIDNGEFVFLPKAVPDADVSTVIRDVNQRINRRIARQTSLDEVYTCFRTGNYRSAANASEQQRQWEGRFKRFEENAAISDPPAMAALYYCHAKGLGIDPDATRAYQWARCAYDSGDPIGLHVLAECYRNGHGVDRNLVEAEKLFAQSATKGVRLSQLILAVQRLNDGSANERRMAFDSLTELSQLPEMAAETGLWLGRGWLGTLDIPGIAPDYGRAITHLEQATTNGRLEAAFDLYRACVSQYFEEFLAGKEPEFSLRANAAKWLYAAAESGHAQAQGLLANELLQHPGGHRTYHDYFPRPQLGLDQDFRDAYKWADLAAVNGDALGQVIAARMSVEGVGTERDFQKALAFLQAAVDQRTGIGYVHQSIWTARGIAGIDVDEGKAMAALKSAAAMGPQYKYVLGRWYWSFYKSLKDAPGIEFGFPRSFHIDAANAYGKDAIKLCKEAAQSGHLDALAFLLLQRDLGWFMSMSNGVSRPDLDSSLDNPDLVFRVARHLELSHLPLDAGNNLTAKKRFLNEERGVNDCEPQIMIDASQYAWFSLWLYEQAALQGHAGAARILDGDRGEWWFRRAERYQSFNMPVEAYWAFELAHEYDHLEAAERMRQIAESMPAAKTTYTQNRLKERWQIRNRDLASRLRELGKTEEGITEEPEAANSEKRQQLDRWAAVREKLPE